MKISALKKPAMKNAALAVCVLCMACLASSCAARQEMTVKEVKSLCRTYSGGSGDTYGGCGGPARNLICDRFTAPLENGFADRAACLAHCAGTKTELYNKYFVEGCGPLVHRAEALCQRHCRSLY